MKIKNMKMMLLGLIGLMSGVSAYAESPAFPVTAKGDKVTKDGVTYTVKAETDLKMDETGRSVDNIVYNLYTIKWTAVTGTASFETKEAYVTGVNSTAANTAVATLTIPATVTGDLGTYNVVGIADNWATALKSVIDVTTTLSVDITNFKTAPVSAEADPIVMKTEQLLPNLIYKDFAKLQSLTITDSYAATATAPARYTAFAGVFADGTKATLTTANLSGSNITSIGENAFKDCTALTGFDFGTKITTIGPSAFNGCFGISELTIPATVTSIGADAFSGMYKAKEGETPAKGLKTLIINGANNTYKTDGTIETSKIPAAFKGNGLLESVTIGSTTATEIEASAFAKGESTYDPAIKVIDLSGATALATIGEGAFPTGCPLETVKLFGTKLTDAEPAAKKICTIDLSAAQKTLATLTFPAGYTTLAESQFRDFVALSKVDLSNTKVTAIPNYAFFISGDVKGDDGKAIAPALAEVKLNEGTTSVGNNAFNGQSALATVTGLNQEKLAEIGINAFNGTALTTLELDKTKLTGIKKYSFGNIATLTSIKLPATVTAISTAAFANDAKVASINLQDTKITVLNPIFHEGVVGAREGSGYETTDKEVAIALTSVTLPEGLITVAPGALQLLDIAEINIPATVESVGAYALQGCVKLSTFTWNDAQSRLIYDNAFRGDDHLTEVKMVTKTNGSTITIEQTGYCDDNSIDVIFKGNKKDVLKFIVNAEDRASLEAEGWSESNLHYCTLTSTGASKFTFNEKAKTGEYYYATYYNEQATWFPEENFEVFGAVVEGSEVVLTPATVEGGYYKVSSNEPCVIRSKSKEAEIELKNADFNDISTLPTDNDLWYGEDITPSRLNFTYKLGIKNGVVAFYRITSGKINGVYIKADTPSDRLDIVVKGEEATAIKGINAAEKKGAIYNLNGMRVNKAGKGVYIQDGKKYVVK